MNTITERLQHYFNNTSREEIERVWNETSIYDDVNSPSAEVFIESASCFLIENVPPDFIKQNFVNITESPNFTSDFLFI